MRGEEEVGLGRVNGVRNGLIMSQRERIRKGMSGMELGLTPRKGRDGQIPIDSPDVRHGGGGVRGIETSNFNYGGVQTFGSDGDLEASLMARLERTSSDDREGTEDERGFFEAQELG